MANTMHADDDSNHPCRCLTQLRCIKQDVTGFLHDHETFVVYLHEDITNVQNSQQDSEKSLKALLDMIRKQNKVIHGLEGKLSDLSSDITNIEQKTATSLAHKQKLCHRIRLWTQSKFTVARNAYITLQTRLSALEKGLGDLLASQRVQKSSIAEMHHDIENTHQYVTQLTEVDTQMKLTQDVVSSMERDFHHLWNQVHELLGASDNSNCSELAMTNTLATELSCCSDSFDASEITSVSSFTAPSPMDLSEPLILYNSGLPLPVFGQKSVSWHSSAADTF
ncbi:hypothetical protein M405DRAFT_868858 [Rhizopogon salebrosus TDB-379]|nr:hypothetical protein M405DRAFT_868858 [Rhizopogon salebrosus TDB-379]